MSATNKWNIVEELVTIFDKENTFTSWQTVNEPIAGTNS